MNVEIDIMNIRQRKCPICGETNKSESNVKYGQKHIATVFVCCNCGYTMTFSHDAKEYAQWLERGYAPYTTQLCSDFETCNKKSTCPKILKGRKI